MLKVKCITLRAIGVFWGSSIQDARPLISQPRFFEETQQFSAYQGYQVAFFELEEKTDVFCLTEKYKELQETSRCPFYKEKNWEEAERQLKFSENTSI